MLIVDETGDAKTSGDCAGAARQYSGTLGGIAMCQVAVTLTCASPAGHALIGRALYLPEGWAADEERRELAGVPDDVMFATKPQLADGLLQDAHDRGIRAALIAGDEVYGGLDLRKSIRQRGTGYVLAVRSNHAVTLPSGRRLTVKNATKLAKPGMWQRMRTGQATKGAKDYHWAMMEVTPDDTPDGHDDGNAVLLLRRHRYTGTISYFLCWTPAPGPAGQAHRRGCHPLEDRGGSPAHEAGRQARQRPGHHLDLLASLDRDQPARLRLPRRGRRLAAGPRRQRPANSG